MKHVTGMWLLTIGVGAALFSGWMGWLDGTEALDLGMGAVSLLGLFFTLWLPWDLYFAARRLRIDQEESRARDIEVLPADIEAARKLPPRLLALALSLHLVGAAFIAAFTWFSQGTIGYYFAASYLLSMLLRPVGAFYVHLRKRLRDMLQRARYPREDVIGLREQLDTLNQQLRELREAEVAGLKDRSEELERDLVRRDDDSRRREARFEAKVDQVLNELESSVAKLTSDRELLQGVRAFVRLVKES